MVPVGQVATFVLQRWGGSIAEQHCRRWYFGGRNKGWHSSSLTRAHLANMGLATNSSRLKPCMVEGQRTVLGIGAKKLCHPCTGLLPRGSVMPAHCTHGTNK
eukprot:1157198-Pelagomonas_calceolata.AAC.10